MKKFIKKHFNKFFIGILTLISAIAIGIGISSNYNKSYAYTSNEISYTIDIYSDSNFTNEIVVQNVGNYSGILINKSIINSDNQLFYFKMKNNTTYKKNYYVLFNWGFWNGSDWDWSLSAKNVYLTIYNNDLSIQQSNLSLGSIINNGNYLPYPFFNTFIARNIYTSDNNNYIYGSLNLHNYTSSYDLFIKNIDIVSVEDISISQYYDTYYSEIENNYNTLLSNYNDLQDNYDILNNNYNDLQDNYDTLDDSYNSLQTDYTNLNNDYANIQSLSQYGDFYGSQIRISGNNLTTINYNFNDLITNNIIINNSINFKSLLDYASINPVDTPCNIDFYLNSNLNIYVNQIYWNINNSNLSGFTADFELLDLLDETFNVSINSYAMPYTLDYRSFIDDIVGSNVSLSNEKLESMSLYINYSLTNDFIISCSTQFQSGYNFGYNSGYSNGVDSSSDVINSLKDNVSSLNSQVNDLQSTINTQSNIITNLNQQVSDLAENNLGWQSIFFTMADTPLKVVHSVLLGDSGNWFFGVNLYSVFIGVIVALACIWIIKKFL